MRLSHGTCRWFNSIATSVLVSETTAAICIAPSFRHVAIKWPSTVVSPQGSSSLGWPIRDEAPAARMSTPNETGEVPAMNSIAHSPRQKTFASSLLQLPHQLRALLHVLRHHTQRDLRYGYRINVQTHGTRHTIEFI